MEYLKIRNWLKWQTYRSDRGQPPWIKIHRRIMRDPEWVSMSDSERGQLTSLWLLAADREGTIPADPEIIKKLCFLDDAPNLQHFIDLKFIELIGCQHDANMTPTCSQDDAPEAEAKAEAKAEADILSIENEIMNSIMKLNLPKIQNARSRKEALSIIRARLEDGYSQADIETHLIFFDVKKKAHKLCLERTGLEPDINSVAWCPNINWRLVDILGPKRMDKYFEVWKEGNVLDPEILLQIYLDLRLPRSQQDPGKRYGPEPEELTEEQQRDLDQSAIDIKNRLNAMKIKSEEEAKELQKKMRAYMKGQT